MESTGVWAIRGHPGANGNTPDGPPCLYEENLSFTLFDREIRPEQPADWNGDLCPPRMTSAHERITPMNSNRIRQSKVKTAPVILNRRKIEPFISNRQQTQIQSSARLAAIMMIVFH
jgi:hypothetical protein